MARRLSVPVLVLLLVAVLVGPGMVAGAQPRVTVTRSLMIPAAAAFPMNDTVDFNNAGGLLWLSSGQGSFLVPLSFPVPVVNVRRIILYALDDRAESAVDLSLVRSSPSEGLFSQSLGQASTTDKPDYPQVVATTAISPRRVNTANYGLFLVIEMKGQESVFYGAKIVYTYEAGA